MFNPTLSGVGKHSKKYKNCLEKEYMKNTKMIIGVLGAGSVVLGTMTGAQAKPAFAEKEGLKCSYCHLPEPASKKVRNYRGAYYGMHNLSFAGFDDAAEAKKAGVPVAPLAELKPKSLTLPEPAPAPKPAPAPVLTKAEVKEVKKEVKTEMKEAQKEMKAGMGEMQKEMKAGMKEMNKAMGEEEPVKPYFAQLGISSLLNSNSRSATSSTGTHITLGYSLGASTLINVKDKPANASIDLTYNTSSGHGNRLSSTGLFYTARAPLTDSEDGIYGGVGVGLVSTTAKSVVSKSKTNLGINLLVGKPLSNGLMVEAGYQIAGSASGVKADSLKLAIGKRF
jgi:hypothetical protein